MSLGVQFDDRENLHIMALMTCALVSGMIVIWLQILKMAHVSCKEAFPCRWNWGDGLGMTWILLVRACRLESWNPAVLMKDCHYYQMIFWNVTLFWWHAAWDGHFIGSPILPHLPSPSEAGHTTCSFWPSFVSMNNLWAAAEANLPSCDPFPS